LEGHNDETAPIHLQEAFSMVTNLLGFTDLFQRLCQPKSPTSKPQFLPTLPIALVFGALLALTLLFRGVGWDGDSILSIAQFEKLIHPQLFDTPVGAFPKFLTIFLFGGFHWLTGSYDIHWITIALTAFAIAKLVYLPGAQGGGPIWLLLPFLSPKWINTVLSADNPPLQVAFLILGLVSLMERKPNLAVFFFLLAELSRPGAAFLIAGIITVSWSAWFIKTFGRLNVVLAGAALSLAILHMTTGYRLGYATFDELFSQQYTYPGSNSYDPERFKGHPIEALIRYFRFIIGAWPSLLSLTFTIPSLIGWVIYLKKNPSGNMSAWLLFFVPLTISPLAAIQTGSLYLEHAYIISAVLPFLAGLALLYNHLLASVLSRDRASAFLSAAVRMRNSAILVFAVLLAFGDGHILYGDFEVNPVAPEGAPKTPLTWISDHRTKHLIQQALQENGRALTIIASCDVNTLMVDVASAADKIIIFSANSDISVTNEVFLKDCNGDDFKKRENDVLLSEHSPILSITNPDVIYTTSDMLPKLDWRTKFDLFPLKSNRFVLKKIASGG
jgi:hypothetical protein